MVIPIPYGTDYSVEVTGSVLKLCRCEACSEEYLYQIERSSTGKETSLLWLDNQGAKDRAADSAQKQLESELEKAIDPVHCPACGWLQSDMVSLLKNRQLYWGIGIGAVLGGLLFALGLIFANNRQTFMVSGGIVFVLGLLIGAAFRHIHEPNAGHPERGSQLAADSTGILKKEYEAAHEASYEEFALRFRDTLKKVMACMIVADGQIDDAEVDVVARIYEQVTGLEFSADEVRSASEEATGKSVQVIAGVRALAPDLNDEARAMFVKTCLLIAGVDGDFDDKEWELLVEVATAAGLGSEEFESIMNEVPEN